MTALASDEYLLQVKCQKLAPDAEDVVWVAKMGDQVWQAPTESELREKTRDALVEKTKQRTGKHGDVFKARMVRTWKVRMVENQDDGDGEDYTFDLFA